MKETAVVILNYVALVIGLCGAAVILWGVVLALIRFVRCEAGRLRGRDPGREVEALRHQFGGYLLLGMELLIVADVLDTIVHPTLLEIGILGGIVAIRTVISYFLDREMAAFRRTHKPEA